MENCRNNPFFSSGACREVSVAIKTNASVNSSSAHPPPPPPPSNRGAFAHVVSPRSGTFAILSRPGAGHLRPPGI